MKAVHTVCIIDFLFFFRHIPLFFPPPYICLAGASATASASRSSLSTVAAAADAEAELTLPVLLRTPLSATRPFADPGPFGAPKLSLRSTSGLVEFNAPLHSVSSAEPEGIRRPRENLRVVVARPGEAGGTGECELGEGGKRSSVGMLSRCRRETSSSR
jgi:hypothetical protein